MPPLYKNCTNLNKRYPHGVGKLDRQRQDVGHASDELQAEHEDLQRSR